MIRSGLVAEYESFVKLPPAMLTWAPMYIAFFKDETAVLSANGIVSSALPFTLDFLAGVLDGAVTSSTKSALRFLGLVSDGSSSALLSIFRPMALDAVALS
jgi:hypothetical protein